jgi:predicted nucleic acid-binding protein
VSVEIVLDTNVVSELLRATPDERVLEWMGRHGEATLLTTITRAELRFGVARLQSGVRRERIHDMVEGVLVDYSDDTLGFDQRAADIYGELMAARERSGRSKPMADTMIAAICLAHGCGLATRNTADFAGAGLVQLVNPFEA